MWSLELIAAGAMIVSLTFYALLGGADYGGGVWDLFARGKRAREQRELIAHAIGPVWEANHVWLILVVVILFTGFPVAFAAIATALHIPLTLLLVGIVLRGSAFTFRTYDAKRDETERRWSRIFSIASIITPILLGITLGGIASGSIRFENGIVPNGFVRPWLAPFPLAVGFFALALFAFLAAVYLTLETRDTRLQDDFRRRALVAGVLVGALALAVFLLAESGAPKVRAGLSASAWAPPLHLATACAAAGAFLALWKRAYRLARVCAAAQVTLILWGWALAQYPYIVEPDITIQSAAAPFVTLRLLLGALLLGALLLFPSFYYLFRVFKGGLASEAKDEGGRPQG
ncbi:MAG TPA: cytochrome d ubiquinol oxidase subunit II [Pyrinomonadaceae bacterium]|jgi:cytochrome d ubiquinol oxidase subunit II|nr:cytochrome d ubiquinol oxidase subunit II [Pyrinomonadaceae bacterium]